MSGNGKGLGKGNGSLRHGDINWNNIENFMRSLFTAIFLAALEAETRASSKKEKDGDNVYDDIPKGPKRDGDGSDGGSAPKRSRVRAKPAAKVVHENGQA